MRKIRETLQHYMNAMHICCRLMNFGMTMKRAKRYAMAYEKFAHRLLYA